MPYVGENEQRARGQIASAFGGGDSNSEEGTISKMRRSLAEKIGGQRSEQKSAAQEDTSSNPYQAFGNYVRKQQGQ